jgi:hypothetical protein
MLYRQDLRTVIGRLTDEDMVAVGEAFPDRATECLALIGDVNDYTEALQEPARLGVALVRLGGLLGESADSLGIAIPPTVFLGRPVRSSEARPLERVEPAPRGVLSRIAERFGGVLGFIALAYGALRKRPFLFDAPGDWARPDLYSSGERFGRRVFISYARPSRALAERFDAALKAAGLEPYRYEPGKTTEPGTGGYTLAEFRAANPGVAEEILRTVQRSSAAIFLLSGAATRSPICGMEAFAAVTTFSPFSSGLYIVRETGDAAVPRLLETVLLREQMYVYEDGLEHTIARDIASRIEQLASFRRTAEERRSERTDD